MKKLILLTLVALVATSIALAQSNPSGISPVYSGSTPTLGTLPYGVSNTTGFNAALGQDVLGAHNGFGRGCVMCHAPHGGAQGNNAPSGSGTPSPIGFTNAATSDTLNGSIALWGENLAPYYGQTVTFVGTTTVTLPASASVESGTGEQIVLLCLSCHDGSLTKPAMMSGQTVEALPIVGGTAPTLFGKTTGNSALTYINEHPVGATPGIRSGKTSGTLWGCTITPGTGFTCSSSQILNYVKNYPASIWVTSNNGLATFYTSSSSAYTVNGVTCTTCHNQHSMTVWNNGTSSSPAFYPTMFFIRGEYMPSTGGNSVAQFCRNCHSGEANEMNGLTSVPTT